MAAAASFLAASSQIPPPPHTHTPPPASTRSRRKTTPQTNSITLLLLMTSLLCLTTLLQNAAAATARRNGGGGGGSRRATFLGWLLASPPSPAAATTARRRGTKDQTTITHTHTKTWHTSAQRLANTILWASSSSSIPSPTQQQQQQQEEEEEQRRHDGAYYIHMVFNGSDTEAAHVAYHHTDSYLLHTLRVTIEARAPSSTSPPSSATEPLLLAQGELLKERKQQTGTPKTNSKAKKSSSSSSSSSSKIKQQDEESMNVKETKVWCTRVWVGDGPGRKEATYDVIAQGMAAAHALGIKNLQVCVDSEELAKEICGQAELELLPSDAHAHAHTHTGTGGSSNKNLEAVHAKIQASIRYFPQFLTAVPNFDKKGATGTSFFKPIARLAGKEGEDEEEHLPPTTLTPLSSSGEDEAPPPAPKKKSSSTPKTKAKPLAKEAAAETDTDDDNDSSDMPTCSPPPPLPTPSTTTSATTTTTQPPPTIDPSLTYLLRFDGGSRGNPGPGGAGAVLYDPGMGTGLLKEVQAVALYLGPSDCTNNEAEYQGLLAGLKAARSLGIRRLKIEGDSQLIVRQILGEYKVRNARLKVLHAEAMELLLPGVNFDSFEIAHIERAKNSEADALANKALDEQRSSTLSSGANSDNI